MNKTIVEQFIKEHGWEKDRYGMAINMFSDYLTINGYEIVKKEETLSCICTTPFRCPLHCSPETPEKKECEHKIDCPHKDYWLVKRDGGCSTCKIFCLKCHPKMTPETPTLPSKLSMMALFGAKYVSEMDRAFESKINEILNYLKANK